MRFRIEKIVNSKGKEIFFPQYKKFLFWQYYYKVIFYRDGEDYIQKCFTSYEEAKECIENFDCVFLQDIITEYDKMLYSKKNEIINLDGNIKPEIAEKYEKIVPKFFI